MLHSRVSPALRRIHWHAGPRSQPYHQNAVVFRERDRRKGNSLGRRIDIAALRGPMSKRPVALVAARPGGLAATPLRPVTARQAVLAKDSSCYRALNRYRV